MNYRVFTAAIAAAVIFAFSGPGAVAQGKQNFTLVNQTGYDISEVYVSPHNSSDWEEDVLGKKILEDDASFEIRFQRSAKTCKWDLKVVYDDDDSTAEWGDIDLCKVAEVEIHYNRKSGKTSAIFR